MSQKYSFLQRANGYVIVNFLYSFSTKYIRANVPQLTLYHLHYVDNNSLDYYSTCSQSLHILRSEIVVANKWKAMSSEMLEVSLKLIQSGEM